MTRKLAGTASTTRPLKQPRRAAKSAGDERAVANQVVNHLAADYPDVTCALENETPFQLLVATILSAQCTDARVNMVTPVLFGKWPGAAELAMAPIKAIEKVIQSTGFFHNKAKNIKSCSQALMERHGGQVPRTMDELVALPGVGRKTANVVLGHALGVPGLPVDRHVLRVSNRLGLVHSDDPVAVETALCRLFPKTKWTTASDTLILHGRRICRPKPACRVCHARKSCDYARR